MKQKPPPEKERSFYEVLLRDLDVDFREVAWGNGELYLNCVSKEVEDDYYEVYGGDYRTQWMDCIEKNKNHSGGSSYDEIRKERQARGAAQTPSLLEKLNIPNPHSLQLVSLERATSHSLPPSYNLEILAFKFWVFSV